MTKKLLFFICIAAAFVLVFDYYFENELDVRQAQVSKEVAFKTALSGSIGELSSLNQCGLTLQDFILVTECVLEKNASARALVQVYVTEEGCIGDIASEVVLITDLIRQASELSLSIYRGESDNNIKDQEAANIALGEALVKIDTISSLNDEEVCRLKNEKT